MKRIVTVLFLATVGVLNAQIISQYIETNSGTTPKGIEIFNNTGSTLDFSINNLVIEQGTNGDAPTEKFTLSTGTLNAGDVLVIGTSDLETTTVSNGAAFYEEPFQFNGDDALVVKFGGTTTDVFGDPGSDPGSSWSGNGVSTRNQNIRLKAGITTGDTDGWTDPSIRFETVNTDPAGPNGDEGFGDPAPLPVELTTFSASITNNKVELHWQTATEVNNYGFNIERKAEKGKWSHLGFVNGHGNSNSPKEYSFIDKMVENSGKYFYRLKQIDIDGQFEYSPEIEVTFDAPAEFELSQNFPNPFNPTTNIRFTLPEPGNVKLAVYTLLGQKVSQLINGNMAAGFHNIAFNGSNLTSGIYIYRLEAGNNVMIRKMQLVK